MRAGTGGFTIQQALSSEAATIIKQAVTLARRRGHAQVTPLHVANTMLYSSTGLLRTACLQSQSQSHPLQCKALELCFNVALNRLPTSSSSSSPMLNPNHSSQHPSISNALVAAFKRAQAHQRRGSIENQQQPLLAVKIELEQLIISILDDPSVSRVMREAGFSSTQVKTNVEQQQQQVVSNLETPSSTKDSCTKVQNDSLHQSNQLIVSVRNEDVMCVIENLLNKRKRLQTLVVVGECVANIEGVVGKVMEKVDKGEEGIPEELKDVKFISVPLFSFGQLCRGDVEQKLGELRGLVKGFEQRGVGVVLYLGDLKWITDYRNNITNSSSWGDDHAGRRIRGGGYYCPIEHLIVELGRLVSDENNTRRKVWVMAISSFQTYIKCRNGNPSLEFIWKLHPLTLPAGGLSLSLLPHSDIQRNYASKNANNGDSTGRILESGEEKQLTCCVDCSENFESEAKSSRSSSLPSWLAAAKILVNNNQDQECVSVKELCKKWNSICTSAHRNKPLFQRSLSFSSVSPSSQASCFSYNQENANNSINRTSNDRRLLDFTSIEKSFELYNLDDEEEPIQRLQSNPNSTPNSLSSSDIMDVEYVTKFKEFNGENLKNLCNALEKKVPWQKDIVPDIAATILKCRSGMLQRKDKNEPKEETWFIFQGIDSQSKEKIAKELAKIVFGSYSNFTAIALSNFSASPRVDSTDDQLPRNKRSRDEESCSYLERFAEAVCVNPHRVFLVEDVEQADYCSQMGIKRAIERGKLTHSSNDEEVGFSDAIIVLSCESLSSRSRTCSPPVKQKLQLADQERGSPAAACVSLDLNISFDEDQEELESMSMDDTGYLLEYVDKCINFSIQDLSL